MMEIYEESFVFSLAKTGRGLQKFMRHEIQDLIDLYTDKVKEIRKSKGL